MFVNSSKYHKISSLHIHVWRKGRGEEHFNAHLSEKEKWQRLKHQTSKNDQQLISSYKSQEDR